MILTMFQYLLYEMCIKLLFDKITNNFNAKPPMFNSIYDFQLGQQFTCIDIIGQHRSILSATVIHINVVDKYINMRDIDGYTLVIQNSDIPTLRFTL